MSNKKITVRFLSGARDISPHCPDQLWAPTNLLSRRYQGLFLQGYSGWGTKLIYSTQSSAKVKNAWSYTLPQPFIYLEKCYSVTIYVIIIHNMQICLCTGYSVTLSCYIFYLFRHVVTSCYLAIPLHKQPVLLTWISLHTSMGYNPINFLMTLEKNLYPNVYPLCTDSLRPGES
jgi:hypothetical protein